MRMTCESFKLIPLSALKSPDVRIEIILQSRDQKQISDGCFETSLLKRTYDLHKVWEEPILPGLREYLHKRLEDREISSRDWTCTQEGVGNKPAQVKSAWLHKRQDSLYDWMFVIRIADQTHEQVNRILPYVVDCFFVYYDQLYPKATICDKLNIIMGLVRCSHGEERLKKSCLTQSLF